jgi:hypothetical protein
MVIEGIVADAAAARSGSGGVTAMRVILLAVVLGLLAGPVHAQAVNLLGGDRRLTSEEIEKNKAIDEAYRSSIRKIPDQKPNSDPWGNVRASGTSQATTPAKTTPAKPTAQKTTKTQSNSKTAN